MSSPGRALRVSCGLVCWSVFLIGSGAWAAVPGLVGLVGWLHSCLIPVSVRSAACGYGGGF